MLSGHCYEGSTLLSAIINESLRINPPVPGALFRELKTDLCFDNVHMPRGTLVGVSAYVLHHDVPERRFVLSVLGRVTVWESSWLLMSRV
jgi:hypothetical protein